MSGAEHTDEYAETMSRPPVCPGCGNRCGLSLCPCCGAHCEFPWRCDDCQEQEHDEPCMNRSTLPAGGAE